MILYDSGIIGQILGFSMWFQFWKLFVTAHNPDLLSKWKLSHCTRRKEVAIQEVGYLIYYCGRELKIKLTEITLCYLTFSILFPFMCGPLLFFSLLYIYIYIYIYTHTHTHYMFRPNWPPSGVQISFALYSWVFRRQLLLPWVLNFYL
jgi:hypothetical protein